MQTNVFRRRSFWIMTLCVCILVATLLLFWETATQAQGPEGNSGEQHGLVNQPVHPSESVKLDSATLNTPKMAGPNAPQANYHWWSTAGSGFMPSSNTIGWYYPGPTGGGCIHPTALGQWRANLNVVEGAQIDSFWFGYYNYTGSMTSTLRLMRYDQRGPELQIAAVTSVGSSGSNNGYKQVSVFVSPNHVVDYSWYSYVFVWDGANPSGTKLEELCSAQVGYYAPSIFGVALPLITR
jgi:hypothetical protein